MNESQENQPATNQWWARKIKGDFAEAVCRAHFESLGYAVESTGIERIAPGFCKTAGHPAGHYIEDIRRFQRLPDFLISRIAAPAHGESLGKTAEIEAVLQE